VGLPDDVLETGGAVLAIERDGHAPGDSFATLLRHRGALPGGKLDEPAGGAARTVRLRVARLYQPGLTGRGGGLSEGMLTSSIGLDLLRRVRAYRPETYELPSHGTTWFAGRMG